MKVRRIETELGRLRIEEKDTTDDKKAFVGAIRLVFEPTLPTRQDAALRCFSVHTPGDVYGEYEWLFSWYKDGRNVNSLFED